MSGVYYGFAAGVYGIIAVIIALALIFGTRARRNVKHERVTTMPRGFSPLDVKRIFIGKTYPRRLTRALLCYWAECGYIRIKPVSKYKVRVIKVKPMPKHDDERAVFFDRGTYVRERDLFNSLLGKKNIKAGVPVDIRRPMFTERDIKAADCYAVREDEGVYSSKHYTLKIVTIALAIAAALLTQISNGVCGGNYSGLLGVGLACIGLCVLMFVRGMPVLFKALWCGLWLGGATAFMSSFFSWEHDPFGMTIVSTAMLYLVPLFLVRFVDYREKNNLDDYSDLVNYRRYLLVARAKELQKQDYYKALPMLYAFGIKRLVARKFGKVPPPDWYVNAESVKGGLL